MNFTFGIITSGSNDTLLEKIVNSIDNQCIPSYEIIIIGNSNIRLKNCIHVPFDESIKPNWITRKKNIICQMAKYENIVLLHDYIYIMDGWYKGFLEFGNDYQVCINKMIQVNGHRYIDYFLSPHGLNGPAFDPYIPTRRLLPYDFKLTPQLSKLCYISGAYYCIKKALAIKYPLNEKLSWGQGEDVELFIRLAKDNIVIKCNSMSTVQLLKYKPSFGEWATDINKEDIKVLNALSEDTCNSIYKNLSNTIYTYYSNNGIII